MPQVLNPARYAINALVTGEKRRRDNYAEIIELHDPVTVPAGFKGVVTNVSGPMPRDPNTIVLGEADKGRTPGALHRVREEVVQVAARRVVADLALGAGGDEVAGDQRHIALPPLRFPHVVHVARIAERALLLLRDPHIQPVLRLDDVRLQLRQRQRLQSRRLAAVPEGARAWVGHGVVPDLVPGAGHLPPRLQPTYT